jgi:hypothetical protein
VIRVGIAPYILPRPDLRRVPNTLRSTFCRDSEATFSVAEAAFKLAQAKTPYAPFAGAQPVPR